MFKISPDTQLALERVEEDKYIVRLIAFLKKNVPDMAQVPPRDMHALIRGLMAQARTFNMKSEDGIAAFVLTAALLGLDFVEKFKGARQILFRPESEADKARLLDAYTVNLLSTLGR